MTNHQPHDHQAHDHTHAHQAYAHTHGIVDPSLYSTTRGIWALKVSFAALMATALFQLVVVAVSGSVALLADTIHNFGDALTAVPLALAFVLTKRPPNRRFTYGYGHTEDLAGLAIVVLIVVSAIIIAYESINRLLNPQPVTNVFIVAFAAIIGFIGNEAVAMFRIRIGNEIGSAALVADGYHARVDGLSSLAVLVGALGVWFGFPYADPLVGLGIAILIGRIAFDAGRSVITRMLGGVDPQVVDEIERAAQETAGVLRVGNVRVRWVGHRLNAELNIAVDDALSIRQAHAIAAEVQHNLMHHLSYLSSATIHVDPDSASANHHHTDGHT
ncbi:MAG: cation transporter [Chloroflexi bacterium]|nr:cation transporter [Chloroflexota bacterium]